MPLPPKSQNAVMRQKILDGALELFVTKGFSQTTVRDVIRQSDVGTGTFYNYFSDKEDILALLLEGFAAQIMEEVSAYYLVKDDLLLRFIETKRITMEAFARNETMSALYCRVPGTSPKIDACIKAFEDKLLSFYEKNISYGIQKGSFRPVPISPVAHSILAMEKHMLFRWVVLGEISKEEMIDMVISFHQTLGQGLFVR